MISSRILGRSSSTQNAMTSARKRSTSPGEPRRRGQRAPCASVVAQRDHELRQLRRCSPDDAGEPRREDRGRESRPRRRFRQRLTCAEVLGRRLRERRDLADHGGPSSESQRRRAARAPPRKQSTAPRPRGMPRFESSRTGPLSRNTIMNAMTNGTSAPRYRPSDPQRRRASSSRMPMTAQTTQGGRAPPHVALLRRVAWRATPSRCSRAAP